MILFIIFAVMEIFCHILVLLTAVISAVYGYKRGLARLTPRVIAVAFGIIAARILAPGLSPTLTGLFPSVDGTYRQWFVYDTVATSLIFCATYAVFRIVTGFIGKVFADKEHTILNNLGGAIFSMFEWLLFLSIAFNLLVASSSSSPLMRAVRGDDGNTLEETMLLSPAVLGGLDVLDLNHLIRLEEAKKIS